MKQKWVKVNMLSHLDAIMRLEDLYEHKELMLIELKILNSELEKLNKEIEELEEYSSSFED